MLELDAMSRTRGRGPALLAAFAASAALGGCLVYNENHCAYKIDNGLSQSPCGEGFACNRCTAEGDGCVPLDQLANVAQACLGGVTTDPSTTTATTQPTTTTVDPSTTSTTDPSTIGDTSTTEMASATDPSTSTTTTTETTVDPSTTGEPICDPEQQLADPECGEPGKPYCVGLGVCGPCTELDGAGKACDDVDPNKSVCDPASGLCVQCTKDDNSACPADKPGCDETTAQCGPCTEHSECPTTACDIETGLCFPEDSVVYVSNNMNTCVGGDGTKDKPFCTLQAVVPNLVPNKPTTIKIDTVFLAKPMPPLALGQGNYIVALVRYDGDKTTPVLEGTNNSESTIAVSTGNRVYLSGLRFRFSNAMSVLRCNSGILHLSDVAIVGDGVNKAMALSSVNCKTVIRRGRIFRNGAGVQVSGGQLEVENSHFTENGTAGSAFGAFNFLGNGATAQIVYSSIALHPTTLSTSTFRCSPGNGSLVLRNSAILGASPLQTMGCVFTEENGLRQEVAAAQQVGVADQWFSGPLDGELSAEKNGPLAGKAMWQVGDPLRDFNGTLRPQDGPGYAGAIEPP